MAKFSKVQTPGTGRESGGLFISPKDAASEFGKLFILSHLRQPVQDSVLDELHEYINRLFYSSAKESAAEALEDVASELNSELEDFFAEYKVKNINAELDLLLGTLQTSELHFAKTGAVHLLLQHGQTLVDITSGTESDEAEPAGPAGDDETGGEYFGTVTSGPLADSDTVLVASASLLDYFSEEKLRQILNTTWADAISDKLLKLVDEFSGSTMFQALVLKYSESEGGASTKDSEAKTDESPPDVAGREAHTRAVQASMSEFNEMSRKTSDIMSTSFFKRFRHSLGGLFSDFTLSDKKDTSPGGVEDLAVRRRKQSRSKMRRIFNNIFLLIKAIFLVIFWILKQLYSGLRWLASNYKKLIPIARKSLKHLPAKTKIAVRAKKTQYSHLPWRRRLLLAAGGIVALVLIISIASGIASGSSKKSRQAFASIALEIEDKRSAADAALIYGDEAQAIAMISEARLLLKDLPDKPKELREQKAQLAEAIFETYKRLQKLEELESPVEIANFASPDEGTSINMLELAGSGENFYGLSDDNRIFSFSLADLSVSPVASLDSAITGIFPAPENNIFVYQSLPEATLNLLDAENQNLVTLNVNFNDVITEKTSVVSYFGRLYVLDPRNRQIYRHSRVGDTYTRGEPWVADDSIDLSSATHMAIDGNVWVVTKAGDLYKISKGEAQDLDISQLDPGLNSPNFIWTELDAKYVYILDPPTRRVVILNPDGSIHKQYVSAHFDDLRSAAINEEAGLMYVLNGSKLFELEIE